MTSLNDKGDFEERPHRPVRYELIDKDGRSYGIFKNATQATLTARSIFPDQEQDEERSGKGWDVQCVGVE